jgi:hypothetical protein
MPNLTISGSPLEVRAKLQRIKDAIDARNSQGYTPKQMDETWKYFTAQDERVCPTCGPLHGSEMRGAYILGDYPYYESVTYSKIMVHNATDYHDPEKCRCTAEWQNIHDTLVMRVHVELSDAVGYVEARVFNVVRRN